MFQSRHNTREYERDVRALLHRYASEYRAVTETDYHTLGTALAFRKSSLSPNPCTVRLEENLQVMVV